MPGKSGDLVAAEGSTSLLDVGLKAAVLGAWPSVDPLRASGWMGLAWLIALLAVTVRTTLRWTGSALWAGIIASLMAISPGLVESAGYLLEGPLFALLWVLALVAAVEARPGRCAAWSLLLAAARPEGLVLAPVLVLWAGLRARSQRSPSASSNAFPWGWAATGLGASVLVTAVRWLRFGELLPNTYYAKASDSPLREVWDGMGYVLAVVWGPSESSVGSATGPSFSSLSVGLSLAVAITAVWWRTRGVVAVGPGGAARGLLVSSGLYALGVIVSGGDGYEGARLFMPIALPLWLALAASLPARNELGTAPGESSSVRRFALLPLTCLLALLPASTSSNDTSSWTRPSRLLSTTRRALAQGPVGLEAYAGDADAFRAVAVALGPDGVFAHVHTQRFRWFEPATSILDLTGLTDHRIARLPAEGRVRFGRFALSEALEQCAGAIHLDPQRARPTSIVDAPSLVEALSDSSVAGRYVGEPFVTVELAHALALEYVGASRALSGGQGYLNLLIHRSRVADFRQQGFRVAAPL